MRDPGKHRFNELRRFIDEQRTKSPLPARESLTPKDECMCQLLGGHLISWAERFSPPLLQERAVLWSLKDWETDPYFVILTDIPGLVAAREILGDSDQAWYLRPEEFTLFGQRHPDRDFNYHIELESVIDANCDTDTRQQVVRKYPLQPGEEYLFHTDITTLGPLFARGGQHLLKWTGTHINLLEEGFEGWVS